jgi:hypothetical protein
MLTVEGGTVGIYRHARRALNHIAPIALGRLGPGRRQRLVVDLVRTASNVSGPVDRSDLHRAVATRLEGWPVMPDASERHLVGLYAVVAETAGVEGAIVECGVGHGASLVPLARANRLFSPQRRLIAFDSFAGFPGADAHDVGPRVARAAAVPTGWDDTSLEMIEASLDAPAELVPGFFADTLARGLPERISLLHVDCDLYESTRDALQLGLPRVEPGGMVIFDEYAEQVRWPGATTAIDEVLAPTPYRPTWDELLGRHVLRIPTTSPGGL